MVFMGADGPEHERDLSSFAQEDVEELRAAMREPGTNDDLDIFVQVHSRGAVRREHIGKRDAEDVEPRERDVASGIALKAFISWALKASTHQWYGPGHYCMLVLWGHAYRFGLGHTATPTGIDALDFAELAGVLGGFQGELQQAYGLSKRPKFDIVGFDACDLATVEVAHQLQPFARYLLASQIRIPLPGWPYKRILKRIRKPFGRVMGPAELGSYAVRRYCESYPADEPASLTLLDLEQAPQLFERTEALARRLAIAMDTDADEQDLVLDLFKRSQTFADNPYVDAADLCLNLQRYCADADVRLAAKRLGDLLISPGPVARGQSERGKGRPLIVDHGRNACEMARLHGLSLYAPHVSSSHDVASSRHFYDKFAFAKETLWGDLVRAFALPA